MAYRLVCKALYDYAAAADDELTFTEDSILYILEADDPEWYKAKLKQDPAASQGEEDKVGLVPANYVEELEPIRISRALYDYTAQTDEELSLVEDELVRVYEEDDDWLLVRKQGADDIGTGDFGYAPKNYIDEVAAVDGAADPLQAEPEVASPPATAGAIPLAPPPSSTSAPDKSDPIQMWGVSLLDKKKKKKGTLGIGNGSLFFASESDKTPVQKISVLYVTDHSIENKGRQISLTLDDEAEVEGNALSFALDKKGEADEVWEKIQGSQRKAELRAQAGDEAESTPVAAAPPSLPSGPRMVPPPSASSAPLSPPPPPAAAAAAPILPPPTRATAAATLPPPQRKQVSDPPSAAASARAGATNGHAAAAAEPAEEEAIALYDFEAQGDDELSVAENEALVVVEKENEDWWKVRNAQGQEGVVPASYVEVKAGGGAAAAGDSTAADEEEARRLQEEEDAAAAAAAAEAERRQQQRRAREAEERRREALKSQPAPAPPRAAPTTATSSSEARAAARDVSIPSGRSAPARPNQASSKGKPAPGRTRIWHDRTGQFRVEAEFLGFNQGKIRLHKLNGVVIEVAIEKMSQADIQYLEEVTGRRLAPTSSASRGTTTAGARTDRERERDRERRKEKEREERRRRDNAARGPGRRNIDWFEFFLAAGVDVDDCTRYASAFERDKIDETVLPELDSSVLRSMGMREGDIIRVTKLISRKFGTKAGGGGAGAGGKTPSGARDEESQIKSDAELARKLQEQEQNARRSGNSTSPAPMLFSGPDGSLKNNTRRGRPTPTAKSGSGVDAASLAAAAEGLARTQSPVTRSSTTSPAISISAAAPKRSGSTAPPQSSGFDDDAWTPRPSSTKPSTPAPAAAAATPSPAPPAPTPPPAPAAPASAAAAPAPSPAPPAAAPASPKPAPDPNSALFDKLAAMKPPSAGVPQRPGASPSPGSGMYGPRGPLAPVPANQGLLAPLIPTQSTGMFVPTGAGGLAAQQTGWSGNGMGGMSQAQSPFGMSAVVSQPTGFFNGAQQQQQQRMATGYHPGVGMTNISGLASPSGGPLSPQMTAQVYQQQQQALQPQATGIVPNRDGPEKFSAASVFGQMKQGQLHQDPNSQAQPSGKYDALRPQPTGFAPGGIQSFGGGMQPQQTGFMQPQMTAMPGNNGFGQGFGGGGINNMQPTGQQFGMYGNGQQNGQQGFGYQQY